MNTNDYMDDIDLRILRVTEDLRAIQRELNCAAMQAPADPELMESLSQLTEMESIQTLKSALDQMRHFLWFYMQIVTSESEMDEKLRQTLRQNVSEDIFHALIILTVALLPHMIWRLRHHYARST